MILSTETRQCLTASCDWVQDHGALAKLHMRQQVLFACACARRCHTHWARFAPNDHRPMNAILAAENWVAKPSGAVIAAARAADAAARAAARAAADGGGAAARAACAAADAACAAPACAAAADPACAAAAAAAAADAAAAAAADAAAAAARDLEWEWAYSLYQCAYRDGQSFPQGWATSDARAIAQDIAGRRHFSLFPLLGDVLEDSGCNDTDLLLHLRTPSDLWTCADWTLWHLYWRGRCELNVHAGAARSGVA